MRPAGPTKRSASSGLMKASMSGICGKDSCRKVEVQVAEVVAVAEEGGGGGEGRRGGRVPRRGGYPARLQEGLELRRGAQLPAAREGVVTEVQGAGGVKAVAMMRPWR